jgi:hypothetical protein
MKSTFTKGDIVKTTEKTNKKINRGKLKESIIDNGVVIANEHFGRIVKVNVIDNQVVSTKSEYLELV